MAQIELVCKQEDVVVAMVEAEETIDLIAVRGAKVLNASMMPESSAIEEGTAMACGRCHGHLFFRCADGELIAAIPGLFKVVS